MRTAAAAAAIAVASLAACSSSGQASPTTSAANPFAELPKVPAFTVRSTSITAGRPLPTAQRSGLFGFPGGRDESPQLSWSGFPAATRSFEISMYDPQAPAEGGLFQWVVVDVPSTVHELAAGAGAPNSSLLPAGAHEIVNDIGMARYVGGAPKPRTGTHDYTFAISALDVATLTAPANANPGEVAFQVAQHVIGRAVITCPTTAAG